MKSLCLAALLILVSPLAQAGGGKHNKRHMNDPQCEVLRKACDHAGYKKGQHGSKDKGLYKDCMDKLVDGLKVKGVSLDPKDPAVDQCRKSLTSAGQQLLEGKRTPEDKGHHPKESHKSKGKRATGD